MSATHSPAATSKLAVHGGPKAKTTPYGSGQRFGAEELKQLSEALDQNTLFYTKGKKTGELRKAFAARYGVGHCVPCSSGTAALHIALAACGVRPGDEVITSPLTDMGTCSAILFCGAIPIFADVDPRNYTLDPASVEAHIGPRTTAIIAVHLTGAPCDMDALAAIARRRDLWLIEDCAQAFECTYRGKRCGSIGDLGCFSLNDFKHISAGDAGLVVTNDPALARAAELFSDKAYDRTPGVGRNPAFLAPNYRMCELHAAVALAQLGKLDSIVARRRRYGQGLDAGLRGIPGILPQEYVAGAGPSYWFFLFRVDERVLGPRAEFVAALKAEGLVADEGCHQGPVVYLYGCFVNRRGFGGTEFPFSLAPQVRYGPGLCPKAETVIADCVCGPVSEFFTDEDLAQTVEGIRKVAAAFAAGRGNR
jgi:perosamine synthetase